MGQHDMGVANVSRQLSAVSPDATPKATPENLSIFSAPALEVVFQWWVESNRRWTERNGNKALILPAVARPEAQ